MGRPFKLSEKQCAEIERRLLAGEKQAGLACEYGVDRFVGKYSYKELMMACEYCTDLDGECCFPVYGVGPHKHIGVSGTTGSWIGSTVMLPKEEWPENYKEDEDCPGMGVWWCSHCGEGNPANYANNS